MYLYLESIIEECILYESDLITQKINENLVVIDTFDLSKAVTKIKVALASQEDHSELLENNFVFLETHRSGYLTN